MGRPAAPPDGVTEHSNDDEPDEDVGETFGFDKFGVGVSRKRRVKRTWSGFWTSHHLLPRVTLQWLSTRDLGHQKYRCRPSRLFPLCDCISRASLDGSTEVARLVTKPFDPISLRAEIRRCYSHVLEDRERRRTKRARPI